MLNYLHSIKPRLSVNIKQYRKRMCKSGVCNVTAKKIKHKILTRWYLFD